MISRNEDSVLVEVVVDSERRFWGCKIVSTVATRAQGNNTVLIDGDNSLVVMSSQLCNRTWMIKHRDMKSLLLSPSVSSQRLGYMGPLDDRASG